MTINPLQAAIEKLGEDADVTLIKSALTAVFSSYGVVHQIDVVAARLGAQKQAICFLRMGSWEQEQLVMRSFNVGRFSGHLAIAVDMPARHHSVLSLQRTATPMSAST